MQAGTAICELDPLFPLEAKKTAPRPRSVFTADAKAVVKEAAESHAPGKRLPRPRLRFTTLTSGCLLKTKSRAERMPEVVLAPVLSRTFAPTTVESGAMRGGATRPSEVRNPVTLV